MRESANARQGAQVRRRENEQMGARRGLGELLVQRRALFPAWDGSTPDARVLCSVVVSLASLIDRLFACALIR